MTHDGFRRLALNLPETSEGSHMGHPDFRVGGKIFASLWPDGKRAAVRLSPEQQEALVSAEPAVFAPLNGAWGRQGWTSVLLRAAKRGPVILALAAARDNVAARPGSKRPVAKKRGK